MHAELRDSCSTILPDPKYKFTRITNFGRLPIQNHLDLDILCYEYPKQFEVGSDNERFYPINSKKRQRNLQGIRRTTRRFR